MDEQKINNNNQCYIVSLDNGIRNEEPVSIRVVNDFNDGTQLVELNNNVFGVYKSNSLNPNTIYIDDFDIIKSDIAELFDVEHEETRRIVTEDKPVGVFTSLNYSQNIETRISVTTIQKEIIECINKGYLQNEEAIWASNTLRIPSGSKEESIKDKTQINDLIELGIFLLNKKIEIETQDMLPIKNKEAIRKSYIRMILFDMIVGRKCRGLDYSLVTEINNNNEPVWNGVRFGPISISNSIQKDSLIGDNQYYINNHYIDKKALIDTLFEYYYEDIKKMTIAINDAMRLYKDAISRIIYNNTELEKASVLEEAIYSNLSIIANYQSEIEKNDKDENKMNKVERTMATQSLNVRVTTKLDLIQKKYPYNPKDEPKSKEKKKNADEKVKLIVEEDKNNKAGFTNSMVLVSIVSLICGLGLGIAYVLLKTGG